MSQIRRIIRGKKKIQGTTERPRLSVTISNRHVLAQIIDDTSGKTLAYSTTSATDAGGSLSKKAEWVGSDIAKKAKKAKINKVVLDRRGKKYHGRIAALADSARKEGLKF